MVFKEKEKKFLFFGNFVKGIQTLVARWYRYLNISQLLKQKWTIKLIQGLQDIL